MVDRTSCTASLQNLYVNFLMTAANASRYTVLVDENPSGVVEGVQTLPAAAAQIGVGHSETYSGYGVSENSAANQELIGVLEDFTQPTVSQPSGTYGGETEPNCHTPGDTCEVTMWAGLASTDYDGPGTASSGTVVQGGTAAIVKNSTVTYYTWGQYFVYGGSNSINYCGSDYTPSPGDTIYVEIGDEYLLTGTSGPFWYTEVNDDQDWVCENTYSDVAAPYYADYIVERPMNTTGYMTLPNFDSVSFYECQYYFTSWVDAYTPYSNGWGFGSQMVNNGSQDTVTDAMYEGTYSLGEIYVGYDDSIGT